MMFVCELMCCVQVEHNETFTLDQEVELVISHKPQSLHCVANLVMAVTKMKRSLSRAKSDEQMCSVIMESLVEGMNNTL